MDINTYNLIKGITRIHGKRFKTLNYVEYEDLVQDVVSILLEHRVIEKYDESKGMLSTWLYCSIYRIIHNITRRHYYKKDGKFINTSRTNLRNNSSSAENCSFFLSGGNRDLDRIIDSKKMVGIARQFFSSDQIDILMGESDCAEVGRKNGVSKQYVHKKLDTDRKKFKNFLNRQLKLRP